MRKRQNGQGLKVKSSKWRAEPFDHPGEEKSTPAPFGKPNAKGLIA
jgi:hypothetical protein